MFIKKYEYEELKRRVEELEREKLNDKMEKTLEELLKEYDYAILVKNYKPTIYNNGRIDEKIRYIKFEAKTRNIPELKIIK